MGHLGAPSPIPTYSTAPFSPVPTQQAPAPVPTQQVAFGTPQPQPSEEFDLVTVTPDGLQVTPLNGVPAPVGLPILETEAPIRAGPYGTVPSFPGQGQPMMSAAGMPTTIFR